MNLKSYLLEITVLPCRSFAIGGLTYQSPIITALTKIPNGWFLEIFSFKSQAKMDYTYGYVRLYIPSVVFARAWPANATIFSASCQSAYVIFFKYRLNSSVKWRRWNSFWKYIVSVQRLQINVLERNNLIKLIRNWKPAPLKRLNLSRPLNIFLVRAFIMENSYNGNASWFDFERTIDFLHGFQQSLLSTRPRM